MHHASIHSSIHSAIKSTSIDWLHSYSDIHLYLEFNAGLQNMTIHKIRISINQKKSIKIHALQVLPHGSFLQVVELSSWCSEISQTLRNMHREDLERLLEPAEVVFAQGDFHGENDQNGWFMRKKNHQNGWCGGSPISGNLHFNRSTRSASYSNWKSRSEARSKAWSICIYLWTSKDLVHFLRPGRQYQAGTESHRNGHQSHPYHREGIWTTQGAKAAWKVMTGQGFQTFTVFQYVFNVFLGGWVKTKSKAIYILLYIYCVFLRMGSNQKPDETESDLARWPQPVVYHLYFSG